MYTIALVCMSRKQIIPNKQQIELIFFFLFLPIICLTMFFKRKKCILSNWNFQCHHLLTIFMLTVTFVWETIDTHLAAQTLNYG